MSYFISWEIDEDDDEGGMTPRGAAIGAMNILRRAIKEYDVAVANGRVPDPYLPLCFRVTEPETGKVWDIDLVEEED